MRRGGGSSHGHGPPVPSSTGLAFPACVHEALVQVSKHVRLASHGRNRPVVAKISELQQLIDNDIFCLGPDRRISRLTALHQFNLLHILAQFFLEKSDDMNKYAYFEALFLGREGESVQHEHRLRTLFRLASFALQFPVLHLFSQISQWLSKMGAGKSYAEDLIGLLVEHFIQPDYETKMYQFLLPLEVSCAEFTVFFVTFAPRHMPINRSLSAVFGSFLNKNTSYILNVFRDTHYLSEVFRVEVFPMLLRYDIECEYSDVETLSFHAGVLAILERWGTKIKKPLDVGILWDSSIMWSRRRCDLICVISSESVNNCRMVKSHLTECKIPASYASLIEDLQSSMLLNNCSEKLRVS